MTTLHIFYIPIIFLIGFIFGRIFIYNKSQENIPPASIDYGLNQSSLKKIWSSSLLLSFLIFLVMLIITHVLPIPYGSKMIKEILGGVEIFDKQPSFSSDEVYTRIETFSTRGIEAYKVFTYSIDIIFPLSFFYFLVTFARYLVQAISKNWSKVLVAIPVAWLTFDFLENLIIYSLLSLLPYKNHFLGSVLGIVTILKFSLLLLSILLPSLLYIFVKKNATFNQKTPR